MSKVDVVGRRPMTSNDELRATLLELAKAFLRVERLAAAERRNPIPY